MTTSVPAPTFTPTGLVLPQEADILSGVQADINAAFGGGLNQALNTPQGQLASSQAAIVGDANDAFAYVVNQVDPATASGSFQDAIGRIYFMSREPGAPTSVVCTCIGEVGTPIPAGALVGDTSGNQYICMESGTIPSGGSISLPFANLIDGPIACAENTVINIISQVNGWNTVSNSAPGVTGVNVETQQAFEYRRQQSVAINARGTVQAIYARVLAVPNVLDCYVTDNFTNATIDTGTTNFPIVAHSVYVAATGGDPQAIANAIWSAKDLGCNTNGSTTMTVVDDSGYSIPYPSYQISYQIPTATPITFAVQIQNNSSLPSNIVTLIQNAIIFAFAGNDGGPRARIGSTLFASRYYAGIAQTSPYCNILSVLIGIGSATLQYLTMGIDQEPTVSASNISVSLV